MSSVAKTGIRYSRAAIIRMTSACMFNLNIFNKISSEVLTIKNDLELNSENQLITKYKSSTSEDYKKAFTSFFSIPRVLAISLAVSLGCLTKIAVIKSFM